MLVATDASGPRLFEELAAKFSRFVAVLRDVADGLFAQNAGDAMSLLKLYERWQKTGSPRAGEALARCGLVPSRSGGVS